MGVLGIRQGVLEGLLGGCPLCSKYLKDKVVSQNVNHESVSTFFNKGLQLKSRTWRLSAHIVQEMVTGMPNRSGPII